MWYGLLLVLLLLVTLVYGLYQFLRAEVKTVEAIQATVYIIAYPVVAYLVWNHTQSPAWLTVPAVAAGVPWIVAGIYLNEIVKDPGIVKQSDFIGFPRRFWIIGGIVSVLIGILLE